jgi:hypothetical protein
MTSSQPANVWTRAEAIARLRTCLQGLCDDEHSMCQVAAECGIFCRGFRRWHDGEFHRRWKGVLGQSNHLTRPQMEEFANIWQLSEQIRCRVGLACDAQTIAPGPCRGWDEFPNETLARFCSDILGKSVIVTKQPADANAS